MSIVQVISSQNTGSTSSSNTGGTTAVNDSGSSTQKKNNTTSGGDRIIYTNNVTDQDYTNYYTSISPALPREYTGVGVVSITGSYTGTGDNINITSSTIIISFTGGLSGSLPVSFSGPISGPGTSLSLEKFEGITDPSVPKLPLNLTIRIFNATVSRTNLTATISISFSAGFVNLDSGIQYRTFAPGFILSNFSGGTLTGSSASLKTVSFTSNYIIHKLFF